MRERERVRVRHLGGARGLWREALGRRRVCQLRHAVGPAPYTSVRARRRRVEHAGRAGRHLGHAPQPHGDVLEGRKLEFKSLPGTFALND